MTLTPFIGNAGVVEILRRAVEQHRLPHALIFSGPSGIGKRRLALLLAQLLNCLAAGQREACGTCASCRKILSGSHPDVREIQPDGAYIKIEQVRGLIGEIAYQPFEARYRLVILDRAEQMRQEAANSLLKTLEEPPSPTIIVLVTTNPYLLLGTIRSRCRMLQFAGIPEDQIEHHLIEFEGRAPEEARLAALFSNGSLGHALSFDLARYQELRTQALRFVSSIFVQREFTEFSQLAAATAKDKESLPDWIEAVEVLLHDVYYAKIAPERMAQRDILEQVMRLSEDVSHSMALSAIECVKKLRVALQHNANRQIALEAMFLALAGVERFGTSRNPRPTNPQILS